MVIALGIDLGTTYTVAAIVKDGRPVVIPNAEGQRLTPSVVALDGNGRPVVGQQAKSLAAANPGNAIYSVKRRMGTDRSVRVGARNITPEEISSLILSKVKADVEAYLGEQVGRTVVTVPAYFNDRQRQATKKAGRLAGLDVIRIINEPTAAALAYGIDREDAHTVLVWDLGGGTFDVSILELGEGIFEVKAVSGNTWLGGDDFDQRLMEHLALEYWKLYGVEVPPHDKIAWHYLRDAAERVKIELSRATLAQVHLPQITIEGAVLQALETVVTRDSFETMTDDLVGKLAIPTRQALADARLEAEDLDRVILVGGSTRIPAVRQKARELLGKEPYRYINPDEVVAMGAAIQAGVLAGTVKRVVLFDVIPLSLGIESRGGVFARVIHRNTPLPASEARIFTTAEDDQTSVDIHVLQGERGMAVDNISLGQFVLKGIPLLPAGTSRIEVAFEVDVDGIVHVSAIDLLGENEGSIMVVSSKSLYPEEMERMVSDAELEKEDSSHLSEVGTESASVGPARS